MANYKEQRLQRKRARRNKQIIQFVAIIVMAIALVFFLTRSQKVESLQSTVLGRVEVVSSSGKPVPEPAQKRLDRQTEKWITNYIVKTNQRVNKVQANEMAKAYVYAANLYNIDVELLVAKDWTESRFDPLATSRDKNGNPIARGVAQFTMGTGRTVWNELGFEWHGANSLYNPAESIVAGAHYLKQLLDRYSGNQTHALEAYNMGPTRLDEFHRAGRTLKYSYASNVKRTMGGI